jgi:hypothetical protein
MQSSAYKIVIDDISIGGRYSTSTTFILEDTLGETGTGNSTSTNYSMNAGYQQMYTSYISITSPSPVTMPPLAGLGGGISTSSLGWTVITDNPAGYVLSVQSTSSPALKGSGGASFADYTPSGGSPDFAFSIAAASSAFGFSPEGADIVSRYKDNGSLCNTGSGNTADACWDPFSTSSTNISQSTASNHPYGALTTIKIRAQIGSSKIQDSGTYNATITATAITL